LFVAFQLAGPWRSNFFSHFVLCRPPGGIPEKGSEKLLSSHCAPPLLQALPSQKAQGILSDLGIGRTLPIYPP